MATSKRRIKSRAKSRTGKLRSAKNVRSKADSKSAELQRIENLLGEDFESLSQARKALKEQSGPVPHKKKYSVSELSSKQHRTIRTFVTDLEDHTAEIDALKYDTDFWAAKIYGHGTYEVYGSISLLAEKLASYRGLQEEQPREALKNIEIIRVHGVDAVVDYQRKKKAEVERRWQRVREQHKLDRKRKRREAAKLKKAEAKVKEQKALIRKLQRELKKKR